MACAWCETKKDAVNVMVMTRINAILIREGYMDAMATVNVVCVCVLIFINGFVVIYASNVICV